MTVALSDIRGGLVTNLETKFAAASYQVNEYVLSSPTAPAFEVELAPDGVRYDEAMGRGLDEYTLTVRGFVGYTTDQGSQVTLDAWLAPAGSLSVKAALESDRTLSGKVFDLRVTQATPRVFTLPASEGNTAYLGAEWTVQVLASGS